MGKAKLNTAQAETNAASNVTPITGTARQTPGGATTDLKVGDGKGAPAVEPHLVVFGLDDGGKAHASTFGAADAELAVKAAGLMRYRVLPITTDAHRAVASGLATGRVFASGKGFVPFAKMAAYEALQAFGEAYQPPPPVEPEPEPVPTATHIPNRHEEIDVGALVLASEAPNEPFYRSIVVEQKPEGLVVLIWESWPGEPLFVRRNVDLALSPPSMASVAPLIAEGTEEPKAPVRRRRR